MIPGNSSKNTDNIENGKNVKLKGDREKVSRESHDNRSSGQSYTSHEAKNDRKGKQK